MMVSENEVQTKVVLASDGGHQSLGQGDKTK